ncbi:MAG: hypothetical protein QOE89_1840, partial [Pseudonocardiales bacterium]|nr:hypothetical protein [Pseudonocardiales bacterium]
PASYPAARSSPPENYCIQLTPEISEGPRAVRAGADGGGQRTLGVARAVGAATLRVTHDPTRDYQPTEAQ